MTGLWNLIRRNCKLFFKDKALFFTSLITPLILLVLYVTFLAKVYKDSFSSAIPKGMEISSKLINGTVGGQLFSSLLAVSCITVAFCSNLISVQDKVNGAIKDIRVTPVKKSTLALSYYISTLISTLIVCFVALAVCLLYVGKVGWYMSAKDILLIVVDVVITVMFGTALSSIINVFLTSQGQMSAVGAIVSSCYGFICGAYMPISQYGSGLGKVLSLLPGTYATSLIRNHAMRGAFAEMSKQGFPDEVINGIKESVDCTPTLFGNALSLWEMFAIVAGWTVVLIVAYIVITAFYKNSSKNN